MAETSSRMLQYTSAAAAAVGMLALSAVVASSAAVGAVAGSIHAGKNIFRNVFSNQKEKSEPENTDMAVVSVQSTEPESR